MESSYKIESISNRKIGNSGAEQFRKKSVVGFLRTDEEAVSSALRDLSATETSAWEALEADINRITSSYPRRWEDQTDLESSLLPFSILLESSLGWHTLQYKSPLHGSASCSFPHQGLSGLPQAWNHVPGHPPCDVQCCCQKGCARSFG